MAAFIQIVSIASTKLGYNLDCAVSIQFFDLAVQVHADDAEKDMRSLNRRHENAKPISASGITDIGNLRSTNQDSFVVLLGQDAPLGGAFIAVADGMGGHAAGEVASQMALDALTDALSNASSLTEQSMRKAVELANRRVYSASTREPRLRGMGTTLVTGLLVGSVFFVSNVGDSRAYLLHTGELRLLTRDHSWVGEMVAKGLLTSEEASTHSRRNVLTRALGIGESVMVDVSQIELRQGDRILLCSDGLHGLVNDSEIAAILSRNSLKRAASELVESAKRAGGTDNITAVVMEMSSVV